MLKLISLNIEQDKHHGKVAAFLKKESPDAVCFQEIFEKDVKVYEEELGMKGFFVPFFLYPSSITKECEVMGIAIFSKSLEESGYELVVGEEGECKNYIFEEPEQRTNRRAVMWATVKDKEGVSYKIANTHFTWTEHGEATPYQIEHAWKMIEIMEHRVQAFVFVGDFNAPRGRETFSMIASRWKDNIPLQYDSSLDPVLHRVPTLRFMVDGLFTTPEYKAGDVRLVEGVSDHKAVVGLITRV